MSYGGEGVARMRVLQVVVLIVFGVIAARLAYIPDAGMVSPY